MRATNGIPLGISLLLPVDTVNCVATLKAQASRSIGLVAQQVAEVVPEAVTSVSSLTLTTGTCYSTHPYLQPPPLETSLESVSLQLHSICMMQLSERAL
jgi:hypothetical protein